jgi:hypothetical protein
VNHRASVIAILAVALAARIGLALTVGNSFQFPDEAVYTDVARRLGSGQGFGAGYKGVPAYPVFLAALAGPFPPSVLLIRVLQGVVTALGAGLVYALASVTVGHRPALAAALVYAIDPMLVVAAGLLYPEGLAAVVMITLALAVMIGARDDRLSLTALGGLLLSFLVQLRPVALLLAPVLSLWSYAYTVGTQSRRLIHAAALILVCVLSLLPWTYRNYRVHGRLMPVATAGTAAAPVSPSEVAADGLTAAIARRAWTEPVAFLARAGREFAHFWELYPTRLVSDDPERRSTMRAKEPRLSTAPMFGKGLRDTVSAITFTGELILAGLGVALTWRARRREALLLLTLILGFAVGYTIFVAKLRYRIPVLPLLFVFTGVGADAVRTFARGASGRGWRRSANLSRGSSLG